MTSRSTFTAVRLVFHAVPMCLAVMSASCAADPSVEIRSQTLSSGGVVLISIDTLRADHLGCYGYARATSPFLDGLAARGTIFENAIAQAPATLPSHMTMLTGLLPAEHDVFPPDDVLSEKIRLLPEVLAAAGVLTAGFTEGGYVSGRFGFSRGFGEFDDRSRKTNTDVEDTFGKGLDFLRSIDPAEPFFLFMHTYAVHDPYLPPPPYCARYVDPPKDLESTELAGFPATPTLESEVQSDELRKRQAEFSNRFVREVLPPDAKIPTGPVLTAINRHTVPRPSPETVEVYEGLYDGTINYVDEVLRVFFEQFEALGFNSSTTVIIVADHGEEFMEHGQLVHEQIYNECMHVPLIVVGPDVSSSNRVRNLVMVADITPTILDIFGIPPHATLSGRSLWHVIRAGGLGLEDHDAFGQSVVAPSETLYRKLDGDVFQFLLHSYSGNDWDPWISRDISFDVTGPIVEFTAMSYHRPQTIDVSIDSTPLGSITASPDWESFSFEIPSDTSKHTVTLVSRDCVSPASVTDSSDTRCLAFRLRDIRMKRAELFDLARDPASATDLSAERPLDAERMESGLQYFQRNPVSLSTSVPLDQSEEDRLRALGYLQ
jgi:arylsulfatase A-like enzyme